MRPTPLPLSAPTMRLLARFLLLMSLVLGLSLAFAWAWDRNDPDTVAAATR